MTHPAFELVTDRTIPEINSRARLYRHKKTGAELLSVENADENKVFGITFRTPPPDSTGIAHIMEHSVLCGSRKYPVKEPFVELMKGSLQTFLNAMTYPDKTVYPVASQNVQDFYNLIDVYLDAVLYPNISEQTLAQEGWHYELESADDPLSFKGVVFNEMKGAYSSPDSVLERESLIGLYPDNPYGLDSGGDPEAIPDLTYPNFKRFHQTYYHPSNARIFFWGDDPAEERLRMLDAWLSEFERISPTSDVPLQPRWDAPRSLQAGYDPGDDPENAKAFVSVNWMLDESTDAEQTFAVSILNHVLLGTPASPLHKALIDSGLGEDLAGGGLVPELRQNMFSTGLKGVALEDAGKVEPLVLATLEKLAAEGIDRGTIEASLNTIEFLLREQNTGAFPRGLFNLLNSLETWLYGGDPLTLLAFEEPLAAVKAGAARPGYFESLIRKHLLENTHRLTVTLTPDAELPARRAAAERSRLENARAGMDATARQAAAAACADLRLRQETPDSAEALATIPRLTRADLEPKVRTVPIELLRAGESQIAYHDLFTNGIVYLDLGMNLHNLPEQLLPYVPLFSHALLETGAGEQDFVQLVQRIGRSTGGIRPTTLTSSVIGRETAEAWLFLRGKAMASQTGELLAILGDVLASARLDNRERIRQLALEAKAGMEASLTGAGHRYANSRIRAHFNESDWAAEQMSGVEQLFFLRGLVERIDSDWQAVLDNLETMRSLLVNQASLLANVTTDAETFAAFRPQLEGFLTGQPGQPLETALWESGARPGSEGLSLPSQVNFVGLGTNLYPAGYQPQGAALVIVPFLSNGYMWDRVRVQGGAYGGFTTFDRQSGVFTFLSYRDPNLVNTLKVYQGAAAHLKAAEVSADELDKAVIGAIGDMDQYQLPDAKGYTSLVRHLVGVTDAERQRLRDQVLGITPADFARFGEVLEAALDQEAVTVVLGSRQAIEEANQALDEPLAVRKVM